MIEAVHRADFELFVAPRRPTTHGAPHPVTCWVIVLLSRYCRLKPRVVFSKMIIAFGIPEVNHQKIFSHPMTYISSRQSGTWCSVWEFTWVFLKVNQRSHHNIWCTSLQELPIESQYHIQLQIMSHGHAYETQISLLIQYAITHANLYITRKMAENAEEMRMAKHNITMIIPTTNIIAIMQHRSQIISHHVSKGKTCTAEWHHCGLSCHPWVAVLNKNEVMKWYQTCDQWATRQYTHLQAILSPKHHPWLSQGGSERVFTQGQAHMPLLPSISNKSILHAETQ